MFVPLKFDHLFISMITQIINMFCLYGIRFQSEVGLIVCLIYFTCFLLVYYLLFPSALAIHQNELGFATVESRV